ncbi:hypothetical protein MJO29_011233, partial [Puccinia striiformis f. sp. tritici]
MSVTRTPPGGNTRDESAPVTVEQHEPIAPANGVCYSVEEIQRFSENEFAWYQAHRHLSVCQEDLIGTNSMNVDPAVAPTVTPPPKPTPHPTPNPASVIPPLVRHYEDDIGKILKGWPEKDLARFNGDPSTNAEDWLGRMKTYLTDVHAHPGVWHSVAGRRFTGTAWNNWHDASINNTRPTDWESFRAWLLARSPLGPTTQTVYTALQKLQQRSDESAKDFISRFQAWQSDARSLDYRYEEEMEFMGKLRSGLAHKVTEAYQTAERDGKKLNLLQLFTTALNCDRSYQASRHPASGSGSGSTSRGRGGNHSGKRRADDDANKAGGKMAASHCYNCKSTEHHMKECPKPKTPRQLAYEKHHPQGKNLLSATDVVQDCLSFEPLTPIVASEEPNSVCVQFHHIVEGRLARVLIDTGAGSSYVAISFVNDRHLSTSLSPHPFSVSGAFGDQIRDNRLAEVKFSLSGLSFSIP